MIRGASGPASDVWSLGVLTYVILCGRPPFNGPNDAAIYSAIEKFDPEVFKKYKFSKHPWPEISDSGKRLVMRMLQKDPRKRPMALELLNDPWVLGDEAPAKPLGTELQTRLQGFAKSTRFRKMALLDVAEQLHPEEIEGLRAVFERFDEDGDGVITVEELQQGLVEAAHGAAGIGLSTAEIAKVDLDGSGVITYEEFIASTIKLNRATQEDALLRAFDSIDLDGDGEISREELRSHIRSPRVFGAVRSFADSEEAVDELLGSADSDGDGRISYEVRGKLIISYQASDALRPAEMALTAGGGAPPPPATATTATFCRSSSRSCVAPRACPRPLARRARLRSTGRPPPGAPCVLREY